jgi:hypothetical protein
MLALECLLEEGRFHQVGNAWGTGGSCADSTSREDGVPVPADAAVGSLLSCALLKPLFSAPLG